MKLFRKFALFIAVLVIAMSLFGCAEDPAPAQVVSTPVTQPENTKKTQIDVIAISGPTGMGMVGLMEANEKGETANDYAFTLTTTPADVVGKLTSKEADIAAVPANLAANLYAKTNGQIQVLALNTLSNLYIVQTEEEQLTLQGLAGKTIAVAGQGATPEYVLSYILEANDLADKVEVKYYSEHSEVVAQLAAGKETVALLPQPFVTVAQDKIEDLVICVNVGDAWEDVCAKNGNSAQIVMGCVVARTEFVQENKAAVNAFLAEYLESVSFASTNVEQTAQLIVDYGIMTDTQLAEDALPSCGVAYIGGATMRDSLKPFLEILHEANPASVGGSLPGDDFYYIP